MRCMETIRGYKMTIGDSGLIRTWDVWKLDTPKKGDQLWKVKPKFVKYLNISNR